LQLALGTFLIDLCPNAKGASFLLEEQGHKKKQASTHDIL
jgi:hypothetical protein